MKNILKKVSLLLAFAIILTACGNGGANKANGNKANGNKTNTGDAQTEVASPSMDAVIDNDGDVIDAAEDTLRVAIISDSTFKGILNGVLAQDDLDFSILGYTMNGASAGGPNYEMNQNPKDEVPVRWTFDAKAKTATAEINPKFKWNNGETVTTDDIIKMYEIVCNQDYILDAKSVRFDEDTQNVVGAIEYNKGEADHISGLEKVDDSKLIVHFKEFYPSILWGGGLQFEFVNAKQYEGIAMKDVAGSDPLRKNPLSYGPYYVTNIVPGESVTFKANEHYIWGAPKIKNLEMRILPSAQAVASMKAGEFDIYLGPGNDIYGDVKDLSNVKTVGIPRLSWNYLGFKLGTWDADKGEIVYNPEAKMADPALRKAMGHAIDNNSIGEKFFNGLSFFANAPIPPAFGQIYDPTVKGCYYDMDLAKKLLDDAGYKDTDGDGFRETPDGKPLVINFAHMAGGETAEPLSQYYMQQWKDIGLNVKLYGDRLMDFNVFYDKLDEDDPEIDAFMAGWNTGSNPDPSGFYGAKAAFNLPRYTSPAMQEVLDKISSNKALDEEFRTNAYKEFQKLAMEEVPYIPTRFSTDWIVINNRVKHFDYRPYVEGEHFGLYSVEVTSKDRAVAQ